MMMSGTKDKEASWEFMKWWLSAEIQTSYGEEMEGLMGEAARYPTANIEAFANLPWPTDDYEALEAQFANVGNPSGTGKLLYLEKREQCVLYGCSRR
jgi:ABC-type glycerol-3-phosphate transport system substrate-binding protein